jgi:hypothetical protein
MPRGVEHVGEQRGSGLCGVGWVQTPTGVGSNPQLINPTIRSLGLSSSNPLSAMAHVYLEPNNMSSLQAGPRACNFKQYSGGQAGIRFCHNQAKPGCGGK